MIRKTLRKWIVMACGGDYKQAIILRADAGMAKGKLVAQGAHASLEAFKQAEDRHADYARAWRSIGMKKIALKVSSEGELLGLFEAAKREKLPCSLIADAGHTQVEAGTLTAVAIGPAPEALVDKLTAHLKLL